MCYYVWAVVLSLLDFSFVRGERRERGLCVPCLPPTSVWVRIKPPDYDFRIADAMLSLPSFFSQFRREVLS